MLECTPAWDGNWTSDFDELGRLIAVTNTASGRRIEYTLDPNDRIVAGRFQCFQVNIATVVRGNRHDLHSHHTDRCGIGPMCGIRDEHLLALVVAARLVIGTHHQHTGELAVRSSCWLVSPSNTGKVGDAKSCPGLAVPPSVPMEVPAAVFSEAAISAWVRPPPVSR